MANETKYPTRRVRNKKFLHSRLKDMYGDDFEPIIKACENAVRMQELATETQHLEPIEIIVNEDMTADEKNQVILDAAEIAVKRKIVEFEQRKECVSAWDKVGQYVSPKLKAVEVGTDPDNPLPMSIPVTFIDPKAD